MPAASAYVLYYRSFSSPEAALLLSAPRIATSAQVNLESRVLRLLGQRWARDCGQVQRHFGFEWLCKYNRLRPEPIRFVRLGSEHAQSDGKSVNRGLPVSYPPQSLRSSWPVAGIEKSEHAQSIRFEFSTNRICLI